MYKKSNRQTIAGLIEQLCSHQGPGFIYLAVLPTFVCCLNASHFTNIPASNKGGKED